MSDFEEMLNGNTPVTQELIRALQKSGLEMLSRARHMNKLAVARLAMAQDLCEHPSKGQSYVCPDCGFDTSPDPY